MKKSYAYRNLIIASFAFLLIISFSKNLTAQNKAAQKWFEKGRKSENGDQKLTFFQKAITQDPSFTEAYYNLALVYKEKGQLEKARQFLGRALLSRPNNLKNDLRLNIVYEMGVVKHKLGQLQDAKKSLLGALNLKCTKKNKVAILNELGQVLIEIGEYDAAILRYKQAKAIDSKNSVATEGIRKAERLKDINKYYSKGVQFLRDHRFQNAITKFEKVLELDENFKDANEKLEQARNEYATQRENENEWQLKYGDEFTNLQSKEERQKKLGMKLGATIERDDNNQRTALSNPAEASYQQGLQCLKNQEWDSAIKSFELTLSITPDFMDAESLLKKAKYGFETNTRSRILNQFYQEGISLLQHREWVKAVIAFEKVLDLNAGHQNAKQKLKEAQNSLDKEGFEIAKKRYYEQAMSAYNSGNWMQVVMLLEKLQKLDTYYKDINEKLTFARSQIDKWKQDSEWERFYQEGEAAFQKKDWVRAVIAYGKAEMLNSNYRDVQIKLLMSQDELHQHSNAGGRLASKPNLRYRIKESWWVILVGFLIPICGIYIFGPSLRGRFYLFLGLHDKASDLYLKLLTKGTISDKLLLALLNLYLLENRRDELAIKIYERTLRLNLGLDEKVKEEVSVIVSQHYIKNWRNDTSAINKKIDDYIKTESKNLAKVEK